METQGGLQSAASELASDPEMVQEFLVESREHLADIENGILALEQEPEDAESLNCVFRSFHTIKALAGFLGASAIHELAHETENVLGLARSGPSGISADMIDLIFRAADELARCLDECRTQNLADVPGCDKQLLASLASAGNLQSTSFTGIQTIGVPRSRLLARRHILAAIPCLLRPRRRAATRKGVPSASIRLSSIT